MKRATGQVCMYRRTQAGHGGGGAGRGGGWDAEKKVKAVLGLDAESRKRWNNSGRVPRA